MSRDDDIQRFLADLDDPAGPPPGDDGEDRDGAGDERTVVVTASPGETVRVRFAPTGGDDDAAIAVRSPGGQGARALDLPAGEDPEAAGPAGRSYEALARQSYEALANGGLTGDGRRPDDVADDDGKGERTAGNGERDADRDRVAVAAATDGDRHRADSGTRHRDRDDRGRVDVEGDRRRKGRGGAGDGDDLRDDDIDDGGAPEAGRPKRRWRRRLVVGGAVTVLAAGGAGVMVLRGGDDGDDAAAATAVNLGTAEVEQRTLEEHAELDGTLGYGDVSQLGVPAQGTVTALPDVGEVVDRGETLVEVDGVDVPLLLGDRPLWRPLGPGATAGVDVQELEENLVALGIASESEMPVDGSWTDATTAAVEEWQAARGLPVTGSVTPGSVVIQPAAVRVAEHLVAEGGSLGGPVLGVTGTTSQITVDLEATRQGLLEVDQAVDVELPDGSETTGTVQAVGTVAEGGTPAEGAAAGEEETEPTVEVTVALDDPAAAGGLDQAPVTVRAVTSAATDVLAVPLEALLVQAGGDFAVEVRQSGGTTDFVTVELGAFADGWVEITGDVEEGDEVVVPVD
jgi:putative peptidoglycan binding protein